LSFFIPCVHCGDEVGPAKGIFRGEDSNGTVDCCDWHDDGAGRDGEEMGKDKGALMGMKVSQAAKVSYQRPVALNDALTYKVHDNEKPRLR
jgi:hypothetical protein